MPRLPGRLRRHLAEPQNRNAYCLLANNVLGAATGLAFLLVVARVIGLPPAEIGVGYAIVSLATLVAVLAKGGLDTALLRTLPHVDDAAAQRLYRFGVAAGTLLAVVAASLVAGGAFLGLRLPDPSALGWALTVAIAVALVLNWLQDARFLADGDAWPSLKRNLMLSATRLAAPFAVVAVAAPHPLATSTAVSLAVSALVGTMLLRRLARLRRPVATVDPEAARPSRFFATALRNAAASASEFLPGLLLVPIVLALGGPEPAAHFAMAWTAATLLFLASSALCRSALASLVRDPAGAPGALRRALLQHAAIVLPAAAGLAVLAPVWLSLFGRPYAAAASSTLALLACSIVLVALGNLHLAVLRARDSPVALAAFPVATVAILLGLTPTMHGWWGLPGVAAAWAVANLPLAVAGLRTALGAMRPVHASPGGVA